MKLTVDTREYVSHLKQLLEDGNEVVVPIAGRSMEPFLRDQRDRVLLKSPADCPGVGDIVFYQRGSGQYVLHRIYKKTSDGWYMLGDHLTEPEGPIGTAAIFAVAVEVERNGRWISADSILWRFAGTLWHLLYPVRASVRSLKRMLRRW